MKKHLNVYKTHVDSYLIYTLHVSNKKECCLLCVAFELWEKVCKWHVNELDENWMCEIVVEFEWVYQVVVNQNERCNWIWGVDDDVCLQQQRLFFCAFLSFFFALKTYGRCVVGIEKIDRYQIRIKLSLVRMDWGLRNFCMCEFAIRGFVSCGRVSVWVLIVTTWNTIYSIL